MRESQLPCVPISKVSTISITTQRADIPDPGALVHLVFPREAPRKEHFFDKNWRGSGEGLSDYLAQKFSLSGQGRTWEVEPQSKHFFWGAKAPEDSVLLEGVLLSTVPWSTEKIKREIVEPEILARSCSLPAIQIRKFSLYKKENKKEKDAFTKEFCQS